MNYLESGIWGIHFFVFISGGQYLYNRHFSAVGMQLFSFLHRKSLFPFAGIVLRSRHDWTLEPLEKSTRLHWSSQTEPLNCVSPPSMSHLERSDSQTQWELKLALNFPSCLADIFALLPSHHPEWDGLSPLFTLESVAQSGGGGGAYKRFLSRQELVLWPE